MSEVKYVLCQCEDTYEKQFISLFNMSFLSADIQVSALDCPGECFSSIKCISSGVLLEEIVMAVDYSSSHFNTSSPLLPPQCGFFKRATKDEYDAAYHKAEIHVQPSDKDKLSAEA